MALFGKSGKGKGKNDGISDDPNIKEPDMVRMYDKYGTEVLIPKSEWRNKVLPGTLKEYWNDPQGLYQTVIMAVDDGFAKDVLAASKRLLSIDPQKERAYCVRGIALMKAGDLDGAEKILNEYLEKHGASGYVITNLAKVFAEQGDQRKSELALWRSLTMDPNQDNALSWWMSIFLEREGEQAAIDALKKAAALPKSWRPQLNLGIRYLQKKDLQEAMTYLGPLLEKHTDEPDVLYSISGDLGQNGYVQELIDLIGPWYVAEKHRPGTGLNLLLAYLNTKKLEEGEKLIHQLALLNRPDLKQQLNYFAQQFAELKKKTDQLPQVEEKAPEIEFVNIDRPVWYYGLEDPKWMFPAIPLEKPGFLFFALSAVADSSVRPGQSHVQHEDELGRLTRSIPLYLAESVFLNGQVPASVFFPLVRGKGAALLGAELDPQQLWSMVSGQGQSNARFIITGSIKDAADSRSITLKAWDCRNRTLFKNFMQYGAGQSLEKAVQALEKDLLGLCTPLSQRPNGFGKVNPSLLSPYLAGLAQSLMLTFVANDCLPKESLFGERNMLNWFLNLALQEPNSQIPKIMFLSGLAKFRKFKSPVFEEFKAQALGLLQDDKYPSNPFYRLSPLLLKIFNMNDEFSRRRTDLLNSADAAYSKWLESL